MSYDKPKAGNKRKSAPTDAKRPERRARGFLRVSELAPTALKSAGAKRGFAELRLLMEWRAVVGDGLADVCRPVKVTYGGRNGPRLGAALIVTTEGSRAPEVDMQKARIIDKVNAFYGYRAISRLIIDQSQAEFSPQKTSKSDAMGMAEAAEPFKGPDAETRLREKPLPEVSDERLGLALSRLRTNILTKSKGASVQNTERNSGAARVVIGDRDE